jgi:hypothetical protein
MSTATANGDASSKGAQPASKQFKPSAAGKTLDGARKQAGSPVDAQNRSVAPTRTGATSTAASPCARVALAHLCLSSRPTIACLFASRHLYTFLTH